MAGSSAALGALGVTACLEHAWAGGLAEVGGCVEHVL